MDVNFLLFVGALLLGLGCRLSRVLALSRRQLALLLQERKLRLASSQVILMLGKVVAQQTYLLFFGLFQIVIVVLSLLQVGLCLLHLLDELEVLVFELAEDFRHVLDVIAVELFLIKVFRHWDQVSGQQCLELLRQLSNLSPLILRVLLSLIGTAWNRASTERTAHGSVTVTAIISAFFHVESDPALTQVVLLVFLNLELFIIPLELILIIDRHEEFSVIIINLKHVLVLLNLDVQQLNFVVQDQDSFVFRLTSIQSIIGTLLVLLSLALIFLNELDELYTILLQVSLGVFKRFISRIFLLLQLIDFLDDSVVRQLDQEHVLLLVNKLVDILWSLLTSELHATLRNLHSCTDVATLVHVEVVEGLVALGGQDVLILDTLQWHA